MEINLQFAVTALVLLSLSACTATNQATVTSKNGSCDFLPPAPQPVWVTGNSQIVGYYTGVGESDARDDKDSASQIARQRAMANLSSSIQTSVSQQLSIQISENSSEKVFQRNLEDHTKTITQNSIKNSVRDAIWLDRRGCRLWMRVKVAEKEVKAIQHKNFNQIRLEQAKQYYQIAVDQAQSQVTRQEKIEEAIQQVVKIDFSVLPLENRQGYLGKYRKLQLQILSQSGSNETLVITITEQEIPKSIHKELAYRISGDLKKSKHIYPAPCSHRDDCLNFARSMSAKRLITVSIQTSTSTGRMGSSLGELTIDAALYDVSSGRQLSQLQNQKGQVLSFDAENIAWQQAIDRLFTNNTAIKQLKNTAHKCSIQKC